MELWTTEVHRGVGLSLKTTQSLYHAKSPFQQIDIVETVPYGRLLLLDGAVMTTDRDEFVYHEMISHVPMLAHPNPKRILVIGGGDGGTVREILKHPTVETVILCEIDGLVVESCREYFPKIASALNHPKLTVVIGDGIEYVAEKATDFDLIIVDSTDPVGPGEGLFTEEFYNNAHRALAPGGMLVAQTESPFVCQDIIQKIYPMYARIFPIVRMYTGHIPTYPSGFWSWAFCSKQHDYEIPSENRERLAQIEATTRYYTGDVHAASFVLPKFVTELLANATPTPVATPVA